MRPLQNEKISACVYDGEKFDCGSKQGYLSANLAVGMRDPEARQFIKDLIKKSGW